MKKMVLHNSVKLRDESNLDCNKKVFITPDLTPKEQEENKLLTEKLIDMNKGGKVFRIKKWTNCTEGRSSAPHLTKKLINTYSSSNCDFLNNSNQFHTQNSFKLLSTNFRGIRFKKESFKHLILSESPNFVAGTET